MSVRIIANVSPNIIANANGLQKSEICERGIIPTTVVIVVSTIGLNRDTEAVATCSTRVSFSVIDALCVISESIKIIA